MTFAPNPLVVEPIIRAALLEDIGRGNDLTTDAIVPADRVATASLIARKPGVVAGIDIATLAFRMLDTRARIDIVAGDGEAVAGGSTVARIECNARALLTGERTALNIASRLCGIATATRQFVDLVAGTNANIVCTRKTTPGFRVLEKYAIRCGGGSNHRFGLDDAVLIKDNHIAIAGSITSAIEAARANVGHMVKIEVEVDTLDQLREAMQHRIDAVLLDNMTPEVLREAVVVVGGRALTEASGTIDAQRVRAVAETGVDLISSGWLTHSAPILDLGLDIF